MSSQSTLRTIIAIILIICVGVAGFISGQLSSPTVTATPQTLTETIMTTETLPPQTVTQTTILTTTSTTTIFPPPKTVTITTPPVTVTKTLTETITITVTVTAAPVRPVTITTDKDVYAPGESLNVSGTATPNASVTIQLFNPEGSRVAIAQTQADANGNWSKKGVYTFAKEDPEGTWAIKAYDSDTGKTAKTFFFFSSL